MDYPFEKINEYILDWYDLNHRILPWRDNPKPYYVWISEIMLQQTRAEAVKDYFERFIEKLPEIEALASAEEESLMKLWEGLGYYNRARNLQKAAKMIVENYEGKLPESYEELLKLPGIGAYTAGAVASIAFGIAVPAVDGNVLRVAKRLEAGFEDITKESTRKKLEMDLKSSMPKERPGDFNQALMELGALICIPNGRPLCDKCPLAHLCKACHQGVAMLLPVKPAKKARKQEYISVFRIEYENTYAICKRPEKGLLSGMWELPNLEEKYTLPKLEKFLQSQGIEESIHGRVKRLKKYKHIFSHIEWDMTGFKIQLDTPGEKARIEKIFQRKLIWAKKEEIRETYSVPTAFGEFIDM